MQSSDHDSRLLFHSRLSITLSSQSQNPKITITSISHGNQPVIPADSAATLPLLQSPSSNSTLRPLSLRALSLSLSFFSITQCHGSPLTPHIAPPPLSRSTFAEATSSARELHHSLLLAHNSAPQPATPSMRNPCGSSHVQNDAPAAVYGTGQEMNSQVSQGLNELYFNVYVDSLFAAKDLVHSTLSQNALGVPYCRDVVIALTSSNSLRVSMGPSSINKDYPNANLNGLEIMKMNNSVGSLSAGTTAVATNSGSNSKNVGVIVGEVLGAVCAVVLALGKYTRGS
ncbi:hypothetical protein PIB30_042127 [Stylosanthes scabra]|uniref:Uncharacterized protein n=1 Tax=Stylosanthes scabra TaxID=79078 RepID=A0ABU6WGE2_9FABA|nr:hypothetical protein [Stylosanthes scabra]